ncbi:PD-(D/E)XK nuclease family protein [Sphingobium sp. D43FB]|uniref:PD-(D/E)XK nuclease family protein n=1 Tax=Sphingobium sp. D43FB TaxID=2017595 RepID=UPI000BD1E8D5|nr:PD-(D/E)XK nuclease family protein [Sphingobium sp. D43FB]PBN43111.1 hypothetical protein SxD43FB_12555 [Sphingobium sp. D43FB]
MPDYIEAYTHNQVAVDFLLDGFSDKLGDNRLGDDLPTLVEAEDFQRLSRTLQSFNAFYAMGRLSNEIRHSNYIAFLLSPTENHEFGARLLHRLFPVFAGTGPDDASDVADIVVMREYDVVDEETRDNIGRLDLLAYDRRKCRVGVVEVKVGSKLGPQQLERYRGWVDRYFCAADDDICWDGNLIYLTPSHGLSEAAPIIPYRIDTVSTRDVAEDQYWTARSFGDISAIFDAFLDEEREAGRNNPALDSLEQYIIYLGHHICPREGCLAPMARTIAEVHGPALRRLREARRDLREQAVCALTSHFAAIGLQLKPKRGGHFLSERKSVVDLVPIEAAFGWQDDVFDDLRFSFNLFDAIPCITVETRTNDNERCRKWREILNYKVTDRKPGKRVLTWKFALPSPINPYPVTSENIGGLVTHVALRIAQVDAAFLRKLKA